MISTSSDRKSVYQSHNRLMPTPLATPSIEYCAMVRAPRESRFPRIASLALRGSPQTPIRARLPEAACNFDILGEPGWTPRLWTERPRHSGPQPADPGRTAARLAGPGQPRRGSHRECDPTPTRSPIEHPRRPAPRGSVNDRSALGPISRGSPRLAGGGSCGLETVPKVAAQIIVPDPDQLADGLLPDLGGRRHQDKWGSEWTEPTGPRCHSQI